jgi:DNA/RNA endonuclease YhcR with UshA esterase domain
MVIRNLRAISITIDPGDISGPKVDLEKLKGVVITVTGKIESYPGVSRIFVKSTSQIVPHRQ